MSKQSHNLAILGLFEAGKPVWTVEEIAGELGVSVRTAYRTVSELSQNGFLDPVSGAGYVLGPAFIRFDRAIRQNDPLIRIAKPGMSELLAAAPQEAGVLLCRLFKNCIMCVHAMERDGCPPVTSYERGVATPLFLGAPAKIILAHLPDRNLKDIYLREEKTIHATGTASWLAFRDLLRAIRQEGYAITQSEVGKDRIGIAAPILRGDRIVASLSVVIKTDDKVGSTSKENLVTTVKRIAADMSLKLIDEDHAIARL